MLDPANPLFDLVRRDKRYHLDAYFFVSDALHFAQKRLNMGREQASAEEPGEEEAVLERHVTGQELCEAIRQYALERHGLLAKRVLNHWGIQTTGDFGEIVFSLIEIGQMRKTPNDRREDFDDVFEFDEGFRDAFEIRLPDSSGESRS